MEKEKSKTKPKTAEVSTPSKTLFIRNLPFTATNDILTDTFKEYGPIQSCFVVNDAVTKESRGIGYVKYTDSADASKALKSVKNLDGRKIYISFANAKSQSVARQSKTSESAATKTATTDRRPAVTGHRLIVRNLPFSTDKSKLKEFFATVGEASSVEIPTNNDGKAKGYGFVFFEDKEVGDKAIETLNQKKLQGRQVTVDWFLKQSEFNKLSKKSIPSTVPTPSKAPSKQCHRLIIRNLPFQISEEVLKKSLVEFGEARNIEFPTNEKGRKKGFAFVTFPSREAAEKVVSELRRVNNRPVAVDWAVDKSTYVSKLASSKEGAAVSHQQIKSEPESTSTKKVISKNNKHGDKSVSSPSNPGKLKPSTKPANSRSNKDLESDDDDSELGSSADSDSEQMESAAEDSGSESESSDVGESEEAASDADSDYEDMDDGDDSGVSDSEKKVSKSAQSDKPAYKTSSADIGQDRTLFLRNVSYDTTEDQLIEVFSQFGDVSYVKLLMDPMTERSRGTAFVQFDKKEHAEQCIEAAEHPQQRSQFFVDGRDLIVTLAVSREKIGELNKAKEKQPKDKRNLYLAREGLIRDGTQAAEGVSKTDINKRMKLETMKRAKLKNPLIFISPLRLCIHNLPAKLLDKQLKAICLKAAAQGKAAIVNECRIMRDLTHLNAEGIGKTRGYGFVAFTEHQHALAALRNLNNNPETFTNEKRPIVEFSLENTKALQAKEKRLQTATSLLSGNTKSNPSKPTMLATTGAASRIERPEGVKPGLPSHHGPKVRHKPRPSDALDPKKQTKLVKKRKERELSRREKEDNQQPKPQKRRMDAPDSFEKLVDSYRTKMSAGITATAKSKWYE